MALNMKNVYRKNNIKVRRINLDDATVFIRKYHYSKIMPKLTKCCLGFFDEDKLLGVVTLGWGTQPLQTIRKIFYKHELTSQSYLEIGKMCFLPECNQTASFGSQILSILFKWMKENTDCLFCYTLADGIMGKCGYVYQASNFRYIGSFKTAVYVDKETGEKIHPRSTKALCEENARVEGKAKIFWLTESFCKLKGIDKIEGLMFRYIFPLTKEAKKILSDYPEYQAIPFPKDKDLIFERRTENGKKERIPQPIFNMNAFKYNPQAQSIGEEEQLKMII